MVEKGKEVGWNQVEHTKIYHKKTANANAKAPQMGPIQKSTMEGQGNKFDLLGFEIMISQEVEMPKEISPSKASPSIKSGSAAKRLKGKISEEEEETQESEESAEEGEIRDS